MQYLIITLFAFLTQLSYSWDVPPAHPYFSLSDTNISLLYRTVKLDGGTFSMGTNNPWFPADGEGPKRLVSVKPFSIDIHEVTNRAFLEFVKQTDHITEAEEFGNSFVMYNLISPQIDKQVNQSVKDMPWWLPVDKALWYQPEGPDSNISTRWDHPVVHVSWNDANAFCAWRNARLPTEAEWEYAARGGLENRLFPWGNKDMPYNRHYANTWQGDFPLNNTGEDGYISTAPVCSYPPNKFGLCDMAGNVWEWVYDSWSLPEQRNLSPDVLSSGELSKGDKVMKGGSFTCHKNYCYRYRCASRSKNTADTSTVHIGIRCATD